jgi:hypothetical protein
MPFGIRQIRYLPTFGRLLILGANGGIGRYMVDYFFERKDEYVNVPNTAFA